MNDSVKSVTIAELVELLAAAEIAADAHMIERPVRDHDSYDHEARMRMCFARGWFLGGLGLDGDTVAAAVARQRAAAALPEVAA